MRPGAANVAASKRVARAILPTLYVAISSHDTDYQVGWIVILSSGFCHLVFHVIHYLFIIFDYYLYFFFFFFSCFFCCFFGFSEYSVRDEYLYQYASSKFPSALALFVFCFVFSNVVCWPTELIWGLFLLLFLFNKFSDFPPPPPQAGALMVTMELCSRSTLHEAVLEKLTASLAKVGFIMFHYSLGLFVVSFGKVYLSLFLCFSLVFYLTFFFVSFTKVCLSLFLKLPLVMSFCLYFT